MKGTVKDGIKTAEAKERKTMLKNLELFMNRKGYSVEEIREFIDGFSVFILTTEKKSYLMFQNV